MVFLLLQFAGVRPGCEKRRLQSQALRLRRNGELSPWWHIAVDNVESKTIGLRCGANTFRIHQDGDRRHSWTWITLRRSIICFNFSSNTLWIGHFLDFIFPEKQILAYSIKQWITTKRFALTRNSIASESKHHYTQYPVRNKSQESC